MGPKLTIAIPTFNRKEKLEKSLEYILKETVGKNVEILVSDNASTDETEKYMNNISNKFSQISYYRRNENGGFDVNFLNCFEKAKGEYVMLIGDDDILLPGSIESILQCISKNPVAIYLNTSRLISRNPIKYTDLKIEKQNNIEYDDKNMFLKQMGIHCTFISALVFNAHFLKNIPNKERFFGTNIIQSYLLFEMLKSEGKYIVNTFNCVAAQGNETVRYDVYNTWIKNYSELLMVHGKKCGFDETILKEQLHKDLKGTIYYFVITFRKNCKNQNKWSKEGIWKYIKMFPDILWKYRIAVYCPRFMLIYLCKIKEVICKVKNKP